jgi:hypothetical protein
MTDACPDGERNRVHGVGVSTLQRGLVLGISHDGVGEQALNRCKLIAGHYRKLCTKRHPARALLQALAF